jgi:hypothetical protein
LADPALARKLGSAGRVKMLSEYDNQKQVAALERYLLEVSSQVSGP